MNADKFNGTELPRPLGYSFSFPSNLRGLGISGAFLNLNRESSIISFPLLEALPLVFPAALGTETGAIVYADVSMVRILEGGAGGGRTFPDAVRFRLFTTPPFEVGREGTGAAPGGGGGGGADGEFGIDGEGGAAIAGGGGA